MNLVILVTVPFCAWAWDLPVPSRDWPVNAGDSPMCRNATHLSLWLGEVVLSQVAPLQCCPCFPDVLPSSRGQHPPVVIWGGFLGLRSRSLL